MKKNRTTAGDWIYRLLNDSRFFVFSLVLFTIHSFWLALSAQSLPYDEYFHLGIIRFYSGHLSPFITNQPPEVSYLGDLTRLPSYLYGYLMSFPYRFFSLFTDNPYVLTVLMRSLNIALVITGLILWRKLLFKIGVPRRLAHLTLFVFMMLPMVVLVAAENNYDNLMFALAPIFFSLTYNLTQGRLTVKNVFGFMSLGLLTCLVKNQFVVIFGLTTALASVLIVKRYGLKTATQNFVKSFKATSRPVLISMTILLVISCGLFAERHGYNLVRYRSIDVSCEKVQPFKVCYQYSPWQRNFNSANDKPADQLFGNPASFSVNWVSTMMRGFVANFANVLPTAKPWDPYGTYAFKPVLPLLIITIYAVLAAGLLSLVVNFKKWWRLNWMRYTILLAGGYLVILWFFNYDLYLKSGQPYAIQPRYLYPLLILILACTAKLIQMLIKNRTAVNWLAGLVLLIFILNGGALGWFMYADSNWYWPNPTNVKVNRTIKPALHKFIFHTAEY